jgi:hypothetical protein
MPLQLQMKPIVERMLPSEGAMCPGDGILGDDIHESTAGGNSSLCARGAWSRNASSTGHHSRGVWRAARKDSRDKREPRRAHRRVAARTVGAAHGDKAKLRCSTADGRIGHAEAWGGPRRRPVRHGQDGRSTRAAHGSAGEDRGGLACLAHGDLETAPLLVAKCC